METTKLKYIELSTDMLVASQVSDYVENTFIHKNAIDTGNLTLVGNINSNALSINYNLGTGISSNVIYTNTIIGTQRNSSDQERTEYKNIAGSRSIVMGQNNTGNNYSQAIFGNGNTINSPISFAFGSKLSVLNGSSNQNIAMFGLGNTVHTATCQHSLIAGEGNNISSSQTAFSFAANSELKDASNSIVFNKYNKVYKQSSIAAGRFAKAKDDISFVWNSGNGLTSLTTAEDYESHGNGTFNINPLVQSRDTWIGDHTLREVIMNCIYEAAAVGVTMQVPYYECTSSAPITIRKEVYFKDGESFKPGVTYGIKKVTAEDNRGKSLGVQVLSIVDLVPLQDRQYYVINQYTETIDPNEYYYVSATDVDPSKASQQPKYVKVLGSKVGSKIPFTKQALEMPLPAFDKSGRTVFYYYESDANTLSIETIYNLKPKTVTLKID